MGTSCYIQTRTKYSTHIARTWPQAFLHGCVRASETKYMYIIYIYVLKYIGTWTLGELCEEESYSQFSSFYMTNSLLRGSIQNPRVIQNAKKNHKRQDTI